MGMCGAFPRCVCEDTGGCVMFPSLRERTEVTEELAKHISEGKPQVGDMDPVFILEMGEILTNGLGKYPNDPDGKPNWWKGGDYRSFCASMGRHVLAIMRGDDIDSCPTVAGDGDKCHGASADYCPSHSRKPHAAHLAVDAMFVRSWQRRGVGQDTRLIS